MPDLPAILAEDGLTLERLFYRLLAAEVRETRAGVDARRQATEDAEGR